MNNGQNIMVHQWAGCEMNQLSTNISDYFTNTCKKPKMSDTPRTQARVRYMIDNNISPEGLEHWANGLERELNAANERIKRLEEACREMVSEEDTYIRLDTWLKAKEAKL